MWIKLKNIKTVWKCVVLDAVINTPVPCVCKYLLFENVYLQHRIIIIKIHVEKKPYVERITHGKSEKYAKQIVPLILKSPLNAQYYNVGKLILGSRL